MADEVKHVGERAFGDMLLRADVLSTGGLASGIGEAALAVGRWTTTLP